MSCAPLRHRFPETSSNDADSLLSWTSIAAVIRKHARELPGSEADEMLDFADLLDGFAELEK